MATRPAGTGSYGERLYEQLAPLAYDDERHGWALLILVGGIGRMHQALHELISDTDEGPGWSALLDVDRCPPAQLPHLAQYVGVRLPVGIASEAARERIRTPAGFRRGTVAALKAAVQETLTGTKTVIVLERVDGNPWRTTVVTRTSETPDAVASERAARAAKRLGLVLTFVVSDDPIIDELGDTIDAFAVSIDDT